MTLVKHAVITGGSEGIGFAIAKILIRNNYNVSLIARNKEKLLAAQKNLEAIRNTPNQSINIYVCDVTQAKDVTTTIERCIIDNKIIDLLISSAGNSYPYLFENTSISDFQAIMDINYFGTVNVIHAVMPYLVQQKRGHILIVSSTAALFGIYGHTIYASSKYALRGLAEALQCEYYKSGVKISIVYPPTVNTPGQQRINLNKAWQNKIISEKAGIWEADKLAKYIYSAIKKHRVIILPGFQTKLLYYLGSFIKPVLLRYFYMLIKRHTNNP